MPSRLRVPQRSLPQLQQPPAAAAAQPGPLPLPLPVPLPLPLPLPLPPIGPRGAPAATALAALPGTDAITLLVAQHRRVEHLLRMLAADAPAAHINDIVDPALRSAASALRTEQLQQVADEMALHMGAEEAVLYPAARAARTDDILLQALEDHLAMRRQLARLLGVAPIDARFATACTQLLALAERQHLAEETQLFPALRRLAGRQRRAELGAQMLRYQAELRRRGRPRESLLAYLDDAAAGRDGAAPAH